MQQITPQYLESEIESEHYWHVPGTMLTVCVLVGKNTVEALGQSSCADPAKYNKQRGEEVARTRAFSALWEAYGIILKAELAKGA